MKAQVISYIILHTESPLAVTSVAEGGIPALAPLCGGGLPPILSYATIQEAQAVIAQFATPYRSAFLPAALKLIPLWTKRK